jgi:hypothetical protein
MASGRSIELGGPQPVVVLERRRVRFFPVGERVHDFAQRIDQPPADRGIFDLETSGDLGVVVPGPTSGVIDGTERRKSLVNDPSNGPNTVESFGPAYCAFSGNWKVVPGMAASHAGVKESRMD